MQNASVVTPRPELQAMHTQAHKSRLVFLIICLLLLTCGNVLAQKAKLTNIIVTNTRDNLLLYLSVKDAFPPEIENTILSGVPATFSFIITLHEVRNLWLDRQITDIKVTHALKYDALKKEYIITRSWEDNKQLNVKSFDEAKQLMTDVDSLIIVPLRLLDKGSRYQIRAKAELSKLTLPFYLHYILFFVSLWDFETDWYTIDFIY
jgi:hypothetical protein